MVHGAAPRLLPAPCTPTSPQHARRLDRRARSACSPRPSPGPTHRPARAAPASPPSASAAPTPTSSSRRPQPPASPRAPGATGDGDPGALPWLLSAKSPAALRDQAEQLADLADTRPTWTATAVARTLATGRARCRTARPSWPAGHRRPGGRTPLPTCSARYARSPPASRTPPGPRHAATGTGRSPSCSPARAPSTPAWARDLYATLPGLRRRPRRGLRRPRPAPRPAPTRGHVRRAHRPARPDPLHPARAVRHRNRPLPAPRPLRHPTRLPHRPLHRRTHRRPPRRRPHPRRRRHTRHHPRPAHAPAAAPAPCSPSPHRRRRSRRLLDTRPPDQPSPPSTAPPPSSSPATTTPRRGRRRHSPSRASAPSDSTSPRLPLRPHGPRSSTNSGPPPPRLTYRARPHPDRLQPHRAPRHRRRARRPRLLGPAHPRTPSASPHGTQTLHDPRRHHTTSRLGPDATLTTLTAGSPHRRRHAIPHPTPRPRRHPDLPHRPRHRPHHRAPRRLDTRCSRRPDAAASPCRPTPSSTGGYWLDGRAGAGDPAASGSPPPGTRCSAPRSNSPTSRGTLLTGRISPGHPPWLADHTVARHGPAARHRLRGPRPARRRHDRADPARRLTLEARWCWPSVGAAPAGRRSARAGRRRAGRAASTPAPGGRPATARGPCTPPACSPARRAGRRHRDLRGLAAGRRRPGRRGRALRRRSPTPGSTTARPSRACGAAWRRRRRRLRRGRAARSDVDHRRVRHPPGAARRRPAPAGARGSDDRRGAAAVRLDRRRPARRRRRPRCGYASPRPARTPSRCTATDPAVRRSRRSRRWLRAVDRRADRPARALYRRGTGDRCRRPRRAAGHRTRPARRRRPWSRPARLDATRTCRRRPTPAAALVVRAHPGDRTAAGTRGHGPGCWRLVQAAGSPTSGSPTPGWSCVTRGAVATGAGDGRHRPGRRRRLGPGALRPVRAPRTGSCCSTSTDRAARRGRSAAALATGEPQLAVRDGALLDAPAGPRRRRPPTAGPRRSTRTAPSSSPAAPAPSARCRPPPGHRARRPAPAAGQPPRPGRARRRRTGRRTAPRSAPRSTVAACDVADRDALAALLDAIPAEHPLTARRAHRRRPRRRHPRRAHPRAARRRAAPQGRRRLAPARADPATSTWPRSSCSPRPPAPSAAPGRPTTPPPTPSSTPSPHHRAARACPPLRWPGACGPSAAA